MSDEPSVDKRDPETVAAEDKRELFGILRRAPMGVAGMCLGLYVMVLSWDALYATAWPGRLGDGDRVWFIVEDHAGWLLIAGLAFAIGSGVWTFIDR